MLSRYNYNINLKIVKANNAEIPVENQKNEKNNREIISIFKIEEPKINIDNIDPSKFSKIRRLNLSTISSINKSGEYMLNQINMKKINLKMPNSKRTLRKNNLENSQSGNNIMKMKSSTLNKRNSINLYDVNDNSIESIPQYTNHILTKEEENNIRNALKNHFVFKDINKNVLDLLVKELIYFSLSKGKIVYEEGDNGNYFYILASGRVESYEKGQFKKSYSPWDCFGELSLLSHKKREETIKCSEKCEFFSLDGEIFIEIQRKVNESILKERFNFLNTISIFKSLDNISKYNVAQKIQLEEFKDGDRIITKGDIGNNLYIIKEGLVSVKIGDKEIRKLGNNDYFGQNAILIDTKRGADIFSINKTICYELSRESLKEALGQTYIDIILYCFFKFCIEENPNLKSIFIESLMPELFKAFTIKIYSKNEKIYNNKISDKLKSNSKRLIIVIEGSIYKEKEMELLASKGNIIGEIFFKDSNKDLGNDLIANPDCITLESTILNICKILKIDLKKENPLNILNRISKLKKIYLFKNLSDKTLELIASRLQKLKFTEKTKIVEEGTTGDTFYIISKGRVEINQNGKFIRTLESGSCFGENVLLSSEGFVERSASIIALDNVVCYTLTKSDFDDIIDDQKIKSYLNKIVSLQEDAIDLNNIYYIKFLGKGKFGTVSLVHNKKNMYAVKAISRKSVEVQKILAKYFVNERRIMLSLDHPFIVKMVKSMKNSKFCFLLLEFVNGKNLDEYLSSRLNKKNLKETQFFSGSLFLILEYLQKKFIAHRDIKPSNIMIDGNGYLKMIDFGTAKILTDYTSTVIGTPHYIPPEILQGKGYSLSCDFWSVGVCIYEIFYGSYPFGNYVTEVIEIYKEILNKKFFNLSKNPQYTNLNNLIKALLNKKVNERLCNIHTIKKSDFFKNFNFSELIDFKLTPPYIPTTKEANLNLNDKNEKYEDYMNKNCVDEGYERYYDEDVPVDYDQNWADEF